MYKFVAAIALSFFVFLLWIIYLANTGSDSVFFDFIKTLPYGDKIGHFGLFGFLTFTAIIAFKYRTFACSKFNIYYGFALVAVFVIAEEISQIFIPSRTFDLVDLAADSVGMLFATAVAYLTDRLLSARASRKRLPSAIT